MARSKITKLRGPGFPEIKRQLQALPVRAAEEIAAEVAPELTTFVQHDYAAGQTVYGDPRPPHPRTGRVPDLNPGGPTHQSLRFRAIGTITEAVLTRRHVKYLIGWFKVMPIGSAALPVRWVRLIDATAKRVLDRLSGRTAA